MTSEQIRERPFIERAQLVAAHARVLFSQYLEDYLPVVDYLSVFSADQADYQNLNDQARHLGEAVFAKNGPVYRLHAEEALSRLPTDIVRVRDPGRPGALIGSADFLAPYGPARASLAGRAGCTESLKSGYRIIQITDPVAKVAIYVPSQQLTKSLMGL